jgi:molybdenum cofactor biosynthesis protein MoaC
MADLSHLDPQGNLCMVDVSQKKQTERSAVARGAVRVLPSTISAIQGDRLPKGNVLTCAKVAGIQAAKRTAELIPLCHQLSLSWVDLSFDFGQENRIGIEAVAKTTCATGVEMEALTAVSLAALTIYDMCKAIDKTMVIEGISLIAKEGGRSSSDAQRVP